MSQTPYIGQRSDACGGLDYQGQVYASGEAGSSAEAAGGKLGNAGTSGSGAVWCDGVRCAPDPYYSL